MISFWVYIFGSFFSIISFISRLSFLCFSIWRFPCAYVYRSHDIFKRNFQLGHIIFHFGSPYHVNNEKISFKFRFLFSIKVECRYSILFVSGHLADRTSSRQTPYRRTSWTPCRRTSCRRRPCRPDTLPTGHLADRTSCRRTHC